MTIHIELKPDEERAFVERARLGGWDPRNTPSRLSLTTSGSRPRRRIPAKPALEDLIDHEFVAACARSSEGWRTHNSRGSQDTGEGSRFTGRGHHRRSRGPVLNAALLHRFDALIKYYHDEIGSPSVQQIMGEAGSEHLIARFTLVDSAPGSPRKSGWV